VARGDPFQSTTDAAVKFEPVTVRLNAALPATALAGLSDVIAGDRGAGPPEVLNAWDPHPAEARAMTASAQSRLQARTRTPFGAGWTGEEDRDGR
jgi:hypothetical protein